jgi:hypothetical protein
MIKTVMFLLAVAEAVDSYSCSRNKQGQSHPQLLTLSLFEILIKVMFISAYIFN